jgi:hypothetical protein
MSENRTHLVDISKDFGIACNKPNAKGSAVTNKAECVNCISCIRTRYCRNQWRRPPEFEESYGYDRPHP